MPFACRIDALTAEQRARRSQLFAAILKMSHNVHEMADGFAVELVSTDEAWSAASEFVTLERRCCPFLSFSLSATADGPARLEITGGPGVKEFLALELFPIR